MWIVGLCEIHTNKLILIPVDDRSKQTLTKLIKTFVRPGSKILSDCWAGYWSLQEEGYLHYSINHKTNFVQEYLDTETGEILQIHTNNVEGQWATTKKYFKAKNGVRPSTFESHLNEIMWRHQFR